MKDSGIVPLFSHDNADIVQQVVEALYQGGSRVFEFTNRKPNSFDTFRQIMTDSSRYPDMLIGVGTIMDGGTAEKFINEGAQFIVSPILNEETASVCKAYDKLWIPGCATLTEIMNGKNAGAGIIKVFPGSVLGPGFVSAIMPVVPDLQLMITGGVEPTEQSLSAWFKAGAVCVGLGSQLITNEILDQHDWKRLAAKTAATITLAKQIRSIK